MERWEGGGKKLGTTDHEYQFHFAPAAAPRRRESSFGQKWLFAPKKISPPPLFSAVLSPLYPLFAFEKRHQLLLLRTRTRISIPPRWDRMLVLFFTHRARPIRAGIGRRICNEKDTDFTKYIIIKLGVFTSATLRAGETSRSDSSAPSIERSAKKEKKGKGNDVIREKLFFIPQSLMR